jgi:RecJ-like exonuclease
MKDYVKCCNCDFEGTVETGAEECPECHYIGALSWAEDHDQEVENPIKVIPLVKDLNK